MDTAQSSPKRSPVDCLFNLINGIAWVCFVTMLVVMLIQVFTRYVINHPLPWTEELSRFAYIWAIFLGSVVAQRSRSHMTVTILVEKFPVGVRRILRLFVGLFSIAALGVVSYGTILQMRRQYGILASSISISYSYIYLALFLGSSLMIVILFWQFIGDVRSLGSSSSES